MTTSSTQLGYLDLAAFYMQAKNTYRECHDPMLDSTKDFRRLAYELADKLTCVIDAIRDDGLDPRWNPERDALDGMWVRGGFQNGAKVTRCQIQFNAQDAQDVVNNLHQRGYKIVKEG